MTRSATKREAPATALPDLQHQFDVLTEALSGTEGTMSVDERRRATEKRNAIAEQIEELENKPHPSESNAARRKRGGWRLEVWLPEEYRDRLDALCEDSGFSRADQIMGLIDAETDEMARIRSRQQSKIKRGMRAVGHR